MEKEQKSFVAQKFSVDLDQLKEIVQKYAQREAGYEELDY